MVRVDQRNDGERHADLGEVSTAACATIFILNVDVQIVFIVDEHGMACRSQPGEHEHLLRSSLNILISEEASLLFLRGIRMVLNRGKIKLCEPRERSLLTGFDYCVIRIFQDFKCEALAVVPHIVSGLQVKLLLDLKFNFHDIHFALRVVDKDAGLRDLIVVEDVLVELHFQAGLTFLASAVSCDFSFPGASATSDELYWGFMDNDHALVFHLLAAVIAQVGDHLVSHFRLAFETVRLVIEHRGWEIVGQNKGKANRVITRLETSRRKLEYGLLELKKFLLAMVFVSLFISLLFPFDFLATFDLEAEVLSVVRTGASNVNLTEDLIAWVVELLMELNVKGSKCSGRGMSVTSHIFLSFFKLFLI